MRIGVVMSPSVAKGPAVVEPSTDFEPDRRRAIEADGLDNMQQNRELHVRKLRGGRSVKF
jgi:hypothetical protein